MKSHNLRHVAQASRLPALQRASCWALCLFLLACEGSFGPWAFEAAVARNNWAQANCGIAVSSSHAAVCATDSNGGRLVAIFRRTSTGNWSFLQELRPRPDSPEPRFGEALDFGGNWLAIGGARSGGGYNSLPAGERMGYVDLYRYGIHDGAIQYGYVRTVEPTAPSGEVVGSDFGVTLALDGNNLIVGARFSGAKGRAFVFDIGTGEQTDQLESPPTSLTDQHYGTVVDAAASRLAVGKPQGCSDTISTCSGEVYLYERDAAGNRVSQLILSPEYPEDTTEYYRDRFGSAVALGAGWLAVADNAPHDASPTGYLYRRSSSGVWEFDQVLELGGSVGRTAFSGHGSALAIADSGTREDTGGAAGRVRVFRLSSASITVESQIIMPSVAFAQRVGVYGRNLIVSDDLTPSNALLFRRQ